MRNFFKRPWQISAVIFLAAVAMARAGAAEKLDYGDISKPEFFPILPWDPLHGWAAPYKEHPKNGLQSIADCNFNMAGFVTPKDLRECRKLGLSAIVTLVDSAGRDHKSSRDWRKLSDAEIDQKVKGIVQESGSNPAIKGYFIMDEPGLPDFPALGKAVAAVKKYAPGKLAYINLFPDYATIGAPDMSQLGTPSYTEYLERFVKEVQPQALSYDNYMVQMSQDMKDQNLAASYYRNLLEVRRVALEHHLPYLNIVSGNQIRPGSAIPSPANLLFQAYTTLAAGYRGVTWYTYYGRGYHYAPIGNDDRKTLTWAYLKEVNRQVMTLAPVMSRLTSTGVFFTAPAPVANLPVLPGEMVESVTCSTPLMIGEFKDAAGKRYAMVVNLSLATSAKFTIKMKNGSDAIMAVSAMDGSLSELEQKNGVWLSAGQGMLLQMGK